MHDLLARSDAVSLHVPEGGIVALLGANGAGKSTTLKAISNLLRAERGDVTKGTIEFQGQRVDKLNPSALVKRGVIQVMEGRRVFEHLSVEEVYDAREILEPLAAQLAIVAATLCYAGAAIFGRSFSGLHPMAPAAGSMLAGAAILIPMSLVLEHPWQIAPSAP